MKKSFLLLFVLAILLFACEKKEVEVTKNMEQIYEENGIPVKTAIIHPQEFNIELPYSATVTGLKQSYVSAMMGGRIEKIYVKVGDYVKKDQVMMEFPEDAPSGKYAQAKAAFKLAESTYLKMKNVYEAGGISELELEQIKTQYEVSKANFDAVSQMLKVRAPISGYVTSITVNETDGVKMETILATVSQTKTLKAKLWITESELPMIKTGQKVTAEWNGNIIEGKVVEVGMTVDPGRNAFGVDVELNNKDNVIKAGVIADIKILAYTNPSAFVVERKNVHYDSVGKYIFVIEGDKARKTYIETGKENGSFEVLSGLKEGDRIVTSSFNLVYDGAKVKF